MPYRMIISLGVLSTVDIQDIFYFTTFYYTLNLTVPN